MEFMDLGEKKGESLEDSLIDGYFPPALAD